MRLRIEPVRATLRGAFEAGHGTVSERDLLLVSLQAGDGVTGHGEAAPLPSYDGTTIAGIHAELEACRPILEAAEGTEGSDLLARCAELALAPQTLAAIDLALWDLDGRRAGEPVWRRLGATTGSPVTVNWTISASDRAGAAREAAAARAAGFETVKVKVAIGDDAGRLAAVRAVAGARMRIRIDANGAWAPEEAEANLRMLEPVGIELCEEPVAGAAAIGALRALTQIPLALDESASDPWALEHRAGDLACLKISSCGGISGLLSAAQRQRTAGYELFLASTLDGPLGIAAALHAAAALRAAGALHPARACGLATLAMFEDRADPLPAIAGRISPPAGPGLGAGLLDWYAAR